ncbi:MAG: YraN family protein [Bacteroidaceae bacterium]|nr:YraN family protein [Bacteroidaceae bacterium]
MSEHYELGKKGEEEAANFLTKKGFYIMHRNWRCGKLELDIVARDGDEIVFVEVKTRRNTYFGYPDEAIDDRKIRRIVSAAGAYVRYYSINLPIRYDVVSVIGMEPPFEIEHVPDAFFPPMWNR